MVDILKVLNQNGELWMMSDDPMLTVPCGIRFFAAFGATRMTRIFVFIKAGTLLNLRAGLIQFNLHNTNTYKEKKYPCNPIAIGSVLSVSSVFLNLARQRCDHPVGKASIMSLPHVN